VVTKKKATFIEEKGVRVEIAESVIAATAIENISDIPGIAGFRDGKIDKVVGRLARGKPTKSVIVTPKEKELVDVDLYLVVQPRVSIPKISNSVKKLIKENIQTLTKVNVDNTIIHVSGIDISKS